MSRIKDTNYYVVHGWMLNQLKLKGTTLTVYAIIYGFAQTEGQAYSGTRKYLAEFCGASVNTIDRCLDRLEKLGLVFKKENHVNGVQFNSFYVNEDTLPKMGTPSPKNGDTPPQNDDTPLPKMGSNNKEIYINKNIYYNAHEPQRDVAAILNDPEQAKKFRQWLEVWKETHGHGKEMPRYRQEALVRLLLTMPAEIRLDAIERAILGGWKAIYDTRTLRNDENTQRDYYSSGKNIPTEATEYGTRFDKV